MKFILGRKVGMTRVFDEEGRSFAVTKIAALPCKVTKINDKERDGYKSIQITAYKGSKLDKAVKIVEFKEENIKRYKVGEDITTKQFQKEELVTIEGTAKGKGFSGTIKRHGFHRGPKTHGSHNVRQPGSIGGGYPERVVLGRPMSGRMGGDNVTIKNLKLIDVDEDIMLIAGSIPGPVKSIIKIYGKGEKAEEVVDHVAEEEKLAMEKMKEADIEKKESASADLPAGKAGATADKEKAEAGHQEEAPAGE